MNENIEKYRFNEKLIEFETTNGNVMVNATQMAKLSGKRLDVFLKTDHVKEFIEVMKLPPNGVSFENLTDEQIIKTRSGSRTFFHRILALKFAAWINPAFELWVYSTIDEILFGYYKRIEADMKISADRINRIDELKTQLELVDEFNELEDLKKEERKAVLKRHNQNRNQLEMFRLNQ